MWADPGLFQIFILNHLSFVFYLFLFFTLFLDFRHLTRIKICLRYLRLLFLNVARYLWLDLFHPLVVNMHDFFDILGVHDLQIGALNSDPPIFHNNDAIA